jgi:hypothetical protein
MQPWSVVADLGTGSQWCSCKASEDCWRFASLGECGGHRDYCASAGRAQRRIKAYSRHLDATLTASPPLYYQVVRDELAKMESKTKCCSSLASLKIHEASVKSYRRAPRCCCRTAHAAHDWQHGMIHVGHTRACRQ